MTDIVLWETNVYKPHPHLQVKEKLIPPDYKPRLIIVILW